MDGRPEAEQLTNRSRAPTAAGSRLPAAETDVGLAELLSIIRRRQWTLVGTVLVSLLLATAFILVVTPRYTAGTLILIESQEPRIASVESVVAGLAGDEATVQSEAYLLGSRALAARVIGRLGLARDGEFNEVVEDGISVLAALPASASGVPDVSTDAAAAREFSAIVDRFLEHLQVTLRENSRVIAVGFSSTDPRRAAEVANVLADEYILSRLESKFASTKRANEWLNERVTELRDKVEAAETDVENARRSLGLLAGRGTTLVADEMVELNTQLVMARTARAEAQARLQQAQQLAGSGAGQNTASEVLDSPLIQRLREQEAELQRRVAELSSEFGELHPRMVQLRAEAKDLQANIAAEVGRIIAGLRNQVSVARARERALEQSLEALKSRVGEANQNEIELRALEREAEASSALLATFLGRQKETVSQEDPDYQQADARVVSAADMPTEPSFPRPKIVLGLVFIAAVIIGLLLILVLELLDSGFRSGEQLERSTGIASLGFVPEAPALREGVRAPDYLLRKPGVAFGESIRTLNWSLTLAAAEQPPRVIVITSAVPGEGKTTVASSVATLHSLGGKKAVLVDADTRKPGVHEVTELRREPGLTDLLAGQARLDEVLVRHDRSGLTVIPAGTPTPNSPGLLASERMNELIRELLHRFDVVVLDTPPVMAASDARILSQKADATVMAVRWASTRREVVKLALRQLEGVGAHIAGCLLTMVNVRKHAQYSYGDSGAYTGDLEKYYGG